MAGTHSSFVSKRSSSTSCGLMFLCGTCWRLGCNTVSSLTPSTRANRFTKAPPASISVWPCWPVAAEASRWRPAAVTVPAVPGGEARVGLRNAWKLDVQSSLTAAITVTPAHWPDKGGNRDGGLGSWLQGSGVGGCLDSSVYSCSARHILVKTPNFLFLLPPNF